MRWRTTWRLAAAASLMSLLLSKQATAEVVQLPQAAPAASSERIAAVVVLVGSVSHDSELSDLLRELLGHDGASVVLTSAEQFEPNQLLQGPATGAVQVFVVPARASGIRLYFRAADGERFLVRSVPLLSEVDALGREQVGQIIQTAVSSLLQSTNGLTRDQARVALEHEDDTATERSARSKPDTSKPNSPTHTTPPAAPPPTRDQSSGTSQKLTALEGWLAARYGASLDGAGIGVNQGPGLELGFGLVERGLKLRLRGMAQRNFARTLSSSSVTARFETLQLELALDAGVRVDKRQFALFSAGFGRNDTRVTPSAPLGSSVAPTAEFRHATPLAHFELRYEYGAALLRAAIAAGADIALADTHYDVARDNTRQRVISPWLIHPTLSLSLALAPSWDPF